jgi:hypothetical protein
MKKIFSIMMMAAAVALVSCGDASGEEGEVTACSCKADAEAIEKKYDAEDADMDAMAKEMDALKEKCKDHKPADCKE